MKSKITPVFALLAILLTGCKNEQLISLEKPIEKSIKMKSVKFQDMNAQMPDDFPDALIDYTYINLEQIASNATISNDQNLRVWSGNNFDEIVESVKTKYPDFENAAPEEYHKFFPELSARELIEKRDVIFQFMEKLMGYEVAISMAHLEKRNGRTASGMRTMYTVTSCEQWYYASHLRLDLDGMQNARDLAFAKAGGEMDNRNDANRHASWNVYLGKYAAYRYGSVNEAMVVVLGLTEAHECGTAQIDSLSKNMDLRNNFVGLQYFVQIAERYKKNMFDHNVRVTKTDDEIFNYISGLNSILVSTTAEIQNASPLNILVRLK